MKQVKQYLLLKEGCVKLTLCNGKEYDSYMLTLMQNNNHALPCERKAHTKTIFYYDVNERIALCDVLSSCVFSQQEACALFIRMMQELKEMEHTLPVYAMCDSIFFDPLTKAFSFVVLPIHDHVYENDWNELLMMILKQLRVNGDSLYGCLYRLCRYDDLSLDHILECLLLWQKRHVWHQIPYVWWERIRSAKQRHHDNEQVLSQALRSQRFMTRFQHLQDQDSKKHDDGTSFNDTVDLFQGEKHAYLQDDQNRIYPIQRQMMIGCQSDCDVVLTEAGLMDHHVKIENVQGVMMVCDLIGNQAVKHNGKRLKVNVAIPLHDGDTVSFAHHIWHFYEERS